MYSCNVSVSVCVHVCVCVACVVYGYFVCVRVFAVSTQICTSTPLTGESIMPKA